MAKILITGGTGFVAKALSSNLRHAGHDVVVTTRQPMPDPSHEPSDLPAPTVFAVGNISGETDWSAALVGVDVVVHLAAQVKMPTGDKTDPTTSFMTVNRDGTRQLAHGCIQAGVKRLVFLSSVLACGDSSGGQQTFKESDQPASDDPYGISKRAAESALVETANAGDLETVIIRPGPVYGAMLNNGILQLIKAVDKGLVLPLGSLENRLDFVYIDNLISALVASALLPNAAGRTFFVSDQDPISTPAFVRMIGEMLGRPARLVPFPVSLLRLAGKVTGKDTEVRRLVNSLGIDSSNMTDVLDWRPSVSLSDGLQRTIEWYQTAKTDR